MPCKIPVFRIQRQQQIKPKSACKRGYDRQWRNLRARMVPLLLASQGAHCAICDRVLILKEKTHLDHVEPFTRLDDPLRLDPRNLRLLCAACNSARSGRGAKILPT